MKKQILTLAVLTMAFFQCLSQAPDTTWTKTLGGSGSDCAQSIIQTSDGGYIVAGYAWSTNGDVHGNHGSNDYWIVKLNNIGDTTWTKSLGGSAADLAFSISQTSDGGYIVAGGAASNNGDVHGHHGYYSDYWIIKLNNSGDTIWTKTLGGSSYEWARSINQTSDGGYIVAGDAWWNNGDVHGNHGQADYWIVKLNSSGDTTWTKSLGGSKIDISYSISQTSDGGYIVAGYTHSNDGDVHGNHGGYDYWIVKLNSSGDTTWTKTLGGSYRDIPYSISQTVDGGYIVAGWSESIDGDVHGNHGHGDCWIVKLNSGGDTTWTKTLGGSSIDHAYSINQTSDGGYIVACQTGSNNGDVHGNHGSNDYWIVKLNNSGEITWTKTLGGSGADIAKSINQISDGGYIVAGYTQSHDGDVHGNHGSNDYWIIKLEPEPDNFPPVAVCQNVTVNADEYCEANVTPGQVDNGSYDPDGYPITLSLDPPGPFQLGETTVTLTVEDNSGETDQCTATVTVVDVTPPVITTITGPIVIWPPNHQYETFVLSDFVLSVWDNCTSLIIDEVNIAKATSDEPEYAVGGGGGNTLDDIVIAGDCKSVQLRKERQAGGNGRVYTIYLELDDGNGNTGSATCHVEVPPNINGTAIYDGNAYEVLGECGNGPSFPIGNKNAESESRLSNYPNPFNSTTTFVFSVAEANKTTLKVYNSMGREVIVLFDGYAEADQDYEIIFNGEDLSEGLYICRMQSGDMCRTKRIVLAR